MSTISIIGSGGMAAAIGGLAAKAGHAVEVTSRDTAKARAQAKQVGAGATLGTFGAAHGPDAGEHCPAVARPRRPLRQTHQLLTRRQPSWLSAPVAPFLASFHITHKEQ
jgi:hypothetical protein